MSSESWTLHEFWHELKEWHESNNCLEDGKILEYFFAFNKPMLPRYLENKVLKKGNLIVDNEQTITELVPLKEIYGDTWLFKNEFIDRRPLEDRMGSLFLAKSPEAVTAVKAFKIDDNTYFTDDGNHRIYSAYLKGWECVLMCYRKASFKI